MRKYLLPALLLLLCKTSAAAGLTVIKPWTRSTLDSARSTAVFMDLHSTEELSIVGASSAQAERVEMRDMRFKLDGGPLRPEPIEAIHLRAAQKLELSPVTQHFVLIGLKQAVKGGDKLPLTLKLRNKSGVESELQLEAIARGFNKP